MPWLQRAVDPTTGVTHSQNYIMLLECERGPVQILMGQFLHADDYDSYVYEGPVEEAQAKLESIREKVSAEIVQRGFHEGSTRIDVGTGKWDVVKAKLALIGLEMEQA